MIMIMVMMIIITIVIVIVIVIVILLKLGCQGVAAPAGRCVLTRISEGRLPPGLANWPADVEVVSSDFIEL